MTIVQNHKETLNTLCNDWSKMTKSGIDERIKAIIYLNFCEIDMSDVNLSIDDQRFITDYLDNEHSKLYSPQDCNKYIKKYLRNRKLEILEIS